MTTKNDCPVCTSTQLCDVCSVLADAECALEFAKHDPFAMAAANGQEIKLGQSNKPVMPKAPRSVARRSWPFTEPKAEIAKPSRWPV